MDFNYYIIDLIAKLIVSVRDIIVVTLNCP